jgi:predicted transcriptional regulator
MNELAFEFLKLFNAFESELKRRLRKDNFVNFSRLIDEASEHDVFIRRNKSLLGTISDLRNVVVHQEGQMITAIPTTEAIEALRSIYKKYTEPKSIYSICKQEVIGINASQKLDEALRIMGRRGFSQLPVLEDRMYVGILTGNAITRYVASGVDVKGELIIDTSKIAVSEVLRYHKNHDDVRFIAKSMTTYELVEIITHDPSPTGVYFITETGSKLERILSICTHGDFPAIWKTL